MTTTELPPAPVVDNGDDGTVAAFPDAARLPTIPLPHIPPGSVVFGRLLILAWVLLAVLALDRVADLLMEFWLFESLGYESVFWTNFRMQAWLFVAGLVVFSAAVILPVLVFRLDRALRRRAISLALLVGVVAGSMFAGSYLDFLGFFEGKDFGTTDPVFHHDIGFYVFDLPAYWQIWNFAERAVLVALVAGLVCAWATGHHHDARPGPRWRGVLSLLATPYVVVAMGLFGLITAAGIFLSRYGLLTKNNAASSIPSGAERLNVTGVFSTLNDIYFSTFTIVAATLTVGLLLRRWAKPGATQDEKQRRRRKRIVVALLVIETLDFAVFKAAVSLRNTTQVQPNEPVNQLEFIQRHIDATRAAWGLDAIEEVAFEPRSSQAPLPNIERLLQSPTIQNAPLWPGYDARLERQIDPEYVERIFISEEEDFTRIYGTTLDKYRQQQKLRPYYDFMDVDTVRYTVDGRPRLFATAVRELPLIEPQPWLAWWGQRFVLFTHGFGLVMNAIAEVGPQGDPVYASAGIPSEADDEALAVENERVYYGEGSGSMAYSNLEQIDEFDFPTEQGRAETRLDQSVDAGVELDSWLKRAVFGWRSREFADIFFSDLINQRSRVHYFRTPLERAEKLAPFLYFDTDPYAVTTGQRISWMLNGLTTSDQYPYSMRADLGDKSDRRTPTDRPMRSVNYAADAVKATVDAYTGMVDLYVIADEPVIATWQDVYPDLFKAADEMPERLQEQVQYPTQLFHAQFDDLFIYYHMTDPLTFFNQEDLWDDGDEVVGPILDEGRAITFSIEPYPWLAETGDELPATEDGTAFALSMVFTPENALNLRAIATVYQDGLDESYGRMTVLQVPKGTFHPGPEQADSAIDQDAFISQQIGLWNRQGNEIIRGHTTPLLVNGELLYVEPLFIRSVQNPAPQLQRVIVVMRGRASIGVDLEDALRVAIEGKAPPGSALAAPPTVEAGGRPGDGGDGGGDSEDDEGGGGPPPGRGGGDD